jgi:hypothetical protein
MDSDSLPEPSVILAHTEEKEKEKEKAQSQTRMATRFSEQKERLDALTMWFREFHLLLLLMHICL